MLFEEAWVFWLLPLPWILYRWLPVYTVQRKALHIPDYAGVVEALGLADQEVTQSDQSPIWMRVAVSLSWLVLVAAAAKPVWLGEPRYRVEPTRDLLLAIDLSRSMERADFFTRDGQPLSRLAAVKSVVAEFLQQRDNDRIGLLVFADQPFPVAPFTQHHNVTKELLSGIDVGQAGSQTALGDAIGLALRLFERSPMDERVLILLTDGRDTSSQVSPEQAATLAVQRGLVIYTIAVGESGEDANGADYAQLERLAAMSNGRFFKAADRQGLAEIYQQLDALLPSEIRNVADYPRYEWFHGLLALVVVGWLLFLLIVRVGRGRND